MKKQRVTKGPKAGKMLKETAALIPGVMKSPGMTKKQKLTKTWMKKKPERVKRPRVTKRKRQRYQEGKSKGEQSSQKKKRKIRQY